MKRFRLIIIALAAIMIFASCKKDPAINIQKIELTKEKITVEPKSATIIGTISYLGKIDSVVVCYADNEYLFNLERLGSTMSGKNFTATITELKPATTYHYYYSVYYGMTNPQDLDVRTFTTTDFKLPEIITAEVSYVGPNEVCVLGNRRTQHLTTTTLLTAVALAFIQAILMACCSTQNITSAPMLRMRKALHTAKTWSLPLHLCHHR